MGRVKLTLSRSEILAFRQRVGYLAKRLPMKEESLRRASWAGLQDSMPRAALLSLYARIAGVTPQTWDDPSLVQIWGPRYNVYVIARDDLPIFSLGTMDDDVRKQERAFDLVRRLTDRFHGERVLNKVASAALGVHHNSIRTASPTGQLLIRWEGARQALIWTVESPTMSVSEARLALTRRYLHVYGPTSIKSFSHWSGVRLSLSTSLFAILEPELVPVATPTGDSWILAEDEKAVRLPVTSPVGARLLPSGDSYTLLHGTDRTLMVPNAENRRRLWTPRVWPGAVLLHGEIVGTWRRDHVAVTIAPWRPLLPPEKDEIVEEAEGLPLPQATRPISITWKD